MKLIFITLALLVLFMCSGNSHARAIQEQDVKDCQAMGNSASLVMWQRQYDGNMDSSLTAAMSVPTEDDGGRYKRFFYALIVDAYKVRRWNTDPARDEAIEQFRAQVLQVCLDQVLEK